MVRPVRKKRPCERFFVCRFCLRLFLLDNEESSGGNKQERQQIHEFLCKKQNKDYAV